MTRAPASFARRALVAFCVLAVAAGVAVGVRRYVANSAPKPTYQTTPVVRGNIIAKVTATGTLSAHVTVLVGSQVSGRVQELFADFNSQVKKGQLLAQMDPQLFVAAVASSQANLTQAVGALAKARAVAENSRLQYDRQKALVAKDLVAQADLDLAKATLDSANADVLTNKGSVAQADAQLHTAQVNLGYTKIISPVDGVVISRSVDIGQTVAAGLQAPTLFTIAQDLHQMQVDTNVAESDVGKLSAGMPATFTVDAYPLEVFKGRVREIRNAPQTLQSVVTYDAVIDVENPDLKLRPGMTANVTFIYAEKDASLEVTNAALRFKPTPEMLPPASASGGPGGAPSGGHGFHKPHDAEAGPSDRKIAWLLKDGVLKRTVIHTGITDGTVTEVTSGDIAEGDLLVLDVTMSGSAKPPAAAGTGAPPGGGSRGMGRMF